jgi:hypothetical protein
MEDSKVPPGFSPPLATVTGDDRTAWVVITTVLGLIYSLLFGLVRIFVSCTTGRRQLQADDIALAVSTVRGVHLFQPTRPRQMRDHI